MNAGAIAEKGIRYELQLTPESEWANRDCLKVNASRCLCLHQLRLQSSACTLSIPELDLHATPSTLGGSFTTVEGLLRQVYAQVLLRRLRFDALTRRSWRHRHSWPATAPRPRRRPLRCACFLLLSSRYVEKGTHSGTLMQCQVIDGEKPATFVLTDPSGNSFVQASVCMPGTRAHSSRRTFTRRTWTRS